MSTETNIKTIADNQVKMAKALAESNAWQQQHEKVDDERFENMDKKITRVDDHFVDFVKTHETRIRALEDFKLVLEQWQVTAIKLFEGLHDQVRDRIEKDQEKEQRVRQTRGERVWEISKIVIAQVVTGIFFLLALGIYAFVGK